MELRSAKFAHVAAASAEDLIGVRVALAREGLQLTQAQLASELGLDRTAVAKIESGNRKVSAMELVRLAAVLDRPIDWFVSESPPAVVSRRQDPVTGGRSPLLDRQIERLARDVDFLEGDGVLPAVEERRLRLPQTSAEAERAAATARGWMGVPDGPLVELQRHSETVGLLAFALNLGDEGGDGAYVAVKTWGVALINSAVDPGRRRFDLAHELGHHLFADAYAPEVTISPASDTERMINAFAVHLLMPRADVGDVMREFEDPRLAAVAVGVRYRVSWTAVCGHLKNLNLIDEPSRASFAASPPTAADFIEIGERWVSELDGPCVPPDYGRRVLAAYRAGRLTAARTVELLLGKVREEELPARKPIPLQGLRKEFDDLP